MERRPQPGRIRRRQAYGARDCRPADRPTAGPQDSRAIAIAGENEPVARAVGPQPDRVLVRRSPRPVRLGVHEERPAAPCPNVIVAFHESQQSSTGIACTGRRPAGEGVTTSPLPEAPDTADLPPSRPCRGLSPRRRGNRTGATLPLPRRRTIPARAGNPAAMVPRTGLSPRRRGNLGNCANWRSFLRTIPAQAGEPDWRSRLPESSWGHPRAGGGAGRPVVVGAAALGPSPRGRGSRGNWIN